MAAKGLSLLTMADVAKSKNKAIGKVAEVLMQHDPMLGDIPYMPMNEKTVHIETIRSGLPEVYYRKANQPIPPSKSTTEERSFSAAHFESKSQIDKMVAARGGKDRIAYNRWNQAKGHIQANAKEHAYLTIYGSPVDATEKTAGLMDVYSTLNSAVPTSKQIVDAGGTGSDNTSMLLVHWGEDAIFGVYPEGTQAGLKREDKGMVQIYGVDKNGNPGTFWGYEEDFEIDHGLVVKDYRQAARIANIDVTTLKSGVGAADLIEASIYAAALIDTPSNGKGFWYVNRTIETYLMIQAKRQVSAGGGLTFENYQGQPVLHLHGRPVRRSDTLLNTESRVVA